MGSLGALCKMSDDKIFKWLLFAQFSFNFNQTLEKACNPGKYRPIHVLLSVKGASEIIRIFLIFLISDNLVSRKIAGRRVSTKIWILVAGA